MPLFLSEEEYERCSGDGSVVAEKADAFIKELYNQLETVKAQADAASITAEQNCSLLEQKYVALSSEFANLQSHHSQLNSSLDQRLSELAQLQAEKHQIHLQSIGKDGEIERLTMEASELHKSKRQLIELLEHKDLEISEKNTTIKGYLDKIVNLTDGAALREARLSDVEADLARSNASCARISQEKELIERHNFWLNDELTAKVNSLIELRKTHNELEADMSAKLEDVERKFKESSDSLKWKNDRVRDLELKLNSIQEELCSSKDAAAATEERFSAELSTVTKLVELYKESSEEWSKKAGELEGVIKALETHSLQVENDYKERLEKEVSAKKEFEKEASSLKQKLEKCEAELESARNANEMNLLPMSCSISKPWLDSVEANDTAEDNHMLIPTIPAGVSGTALAASLLRDGWSLAKMYAKYQEAVDAMRHEQLGRKQSQVILERVLYEIEEKAGVILDERAEHERLVEAYAAVNQKLQHSLSEQGTLERTIQELKVDLRKHERDSSLSQKEIADLQKQVTVLLKECRDIQLRCGSAGHDYASEDMAVPAGQFSAESDAEKVISERLLTFRDINGLVEQNVQLRSLVRSLSDQLDNRDLELKVNFEKELHKQSDEAASKVNAVLARAEEQGRMLESLHTSVAMYKKLYEEEHKLRSSYPHSQEAAPGLFIFSSIPDLFHRTIFCMNLASLLFWMLMNYLLSVLRRELFLTWGHDDLFQRAKAARILVVLLRKHEYDARYQKPEEKIYIAQLYFPLVGQILDEITVFCKMNAVEKREVLIVILVIVRNLDDESLVKAWQQSTARTRLFFKLLEQCLILFEHRNPADSMLMGSSYLSPITNGPTSPMYSDTLSPAINQYPSEELPEEVSPRGTPWSGFLCQPYSLVEAFSGSESSKTGASTAAPMESMEPISRRKLELCEENLRAAVSLQVLEITEKFSKAAAFHSIATNYGKLDCISSMFISFFSQNQPLAFWEALLPVFKSVFELHGATLMARQNDRFLKKITFHLLRLAAFRNMKIRRCAVVGLQILIRSSFSYFMQTARLRVILTIALSELMSDVQVTQLNPNGAFEESGEAIFLRKSLEEVADESMSRSMLRECGLPQNVLAATSETLNENQWSWSEVKSLSDGLILALDAILEHAVLASPMNEDKYAATESFYKVAIAFAPVPDLHIMWLLNLCDAHQEMGCEAEAAQCAAAAAGFIMQAFTSGKYRVWSNFHMTELRKICPVVSSKITSRSSAAEIEGYGFSKIKVESAVKYLEAARMHFFKAELYHFCKKILNLIIPAYESSLSYDRLKQCYTMLGDICDSISKQESHPDAKYYRVGFYGGNFGKLNGKEYVYREPRGVLLGDLKEKLSLIYKSRMDGNHPLHIIPDSGPVKADGLQVGVSYLQITAVEPVMENEDVGSRRERIFSLTTGTRHERAFDHFVFDTPFTKNGKNQGGLEDQWRRRTILQTEGSFPALVSRHMVIKSEYLEFSPLENAIGMIEARTAALQDELEKPHSSTDGHRRVQNLERVLQGSVAVQVNSGIRGVCTAFLSGEAATRLSQLELQLLSNTLHEFMAVCREAIQAHYKLIRHEDLDFHEQLESGYWSLREELSRYIPGNLPEL